MKFMVTRQPRIYSNFRQFHLIFPQRDLDGMHFADDYFGSRNLIDAILAFAGICPTNYIL